MLRILVYSLENVLREIEFFDRTAKEWRLDLARWKERKGTRDYTAEMARISSTGKIEEGLLFLWAMEKVYLDTWTAISDNLASINRPHSALRLLAKNWSTDEFKAFVDDLASLVDDLYRDLDRNAWIMAEEIWRRVLELEEGFWPGYDEGEKDLAL
ncbi:hypothetical protein E4T56_gene11265 [Termitomyces sp. T112]|nr:hypothetical protein C0989_011519 [Termitomyces sp. Mn162]KAG5723974.1 hypothetical protein E4T56_gene11265 [Termitomyces sp. T112]KNZ78029.1 hypothetical protein J132_02673 [Termitomyces sp. J132]